MNRLMLLAAAALSLTACNRADRPETKAEADRGEALRSISRLDCPDKQGDLKLVTAATDGKTCAYQADGAEVTLRLIALTNGDARAALAPLEAELKGLVPPPAKDVGEKAAADADDRGGKAQIDFPGLHIKADDSGAKVRIGSIKVDADDAGAEVRVGDETTVNATDAGAEIRHARTGDAIRSTYILASDKAPGGYHVVGYEARGPRAGPLVVAVVKAKEEDHDQHDLFDDMKDLVKRNVGG